jgi:hypothetical protein
VRTDTRRPGLRDIAGRLALAFGCGLALVAGAACGGGGRRADVPQPALTAASGTATALAATEPSATPEVLPTEAPSASETGSGVLPLLFGGALGDTNSARSIGSGDPSLQKYVLQASDLPRGYTVMSSGTQEVHDGISGSGTVDMAMMLAVHGQPESGDPRMLLSMAMRFSDLQALDKTFSQLDSKSLADQIGSAGLPQGLVKDVHTLPTDGLGAQATGFAMTMDIGKLIGSIASALGDGTPAALPTGVPTSIQMQMYLFARGSYAGAVMAMTYGDASGSGPDLLSLAKVAERKLAGAPN